MIRDVGSAGFVARDGFAARGRGRRVVERDPVVVIIDRPPLRSSRSGSAPAPSAAAQEQAGAQAHLPMTCRGTTKFPWRGRRGCCGSRNSPFERSSAERGEDLTLPFCIRFFSCQWSVARLRDCNPC